VVHILGLGNWAGISFAEIMGEKLFQTMAAKANIGSGL